MDLSKLSNEELLAIAGQEQQSPLAGMSDDELAAAAGVKSPVHNVSQTKAGILGAAQGATAGFSDEIAGLVGGAAEFISPTTPGIGRFEAARRGYEGTRDIVREQQEEAAAVHPGTYTTGQVGGSLIPAGTAFKALKGGQSLARAVGAGAAMGGTAGLGAAEGDAEQQLTEAAKGAALGAIAGGGGYGAGKVIDKVGEAAKWGSSKVAQAIFDKANELTANKQPGMAGYQNLLFPGITPERATKIVRRTESAKPALAKAWEGVAARAKEFRKSPTGAEVALSGGMYAAGVDPQTIAMVVGGKRTIQAIGGTGSGMLTTKAALDTISKYAPTIEKAVASGTPFAAINFTLAQQSPEYRQASKAIESDEETEETSDN